MMKCCRMLQETVEDTEAGQRGRSAAQRKENSHCSLSSFRGPWLGPRGRSALASVRRRRCLPPARPSG
eukprot:365328-Chlamydomonas_euryale.AAC.5